MTARVSFPPVGVRFPLTSAATERCASYMLGAKRGGGDPIRNHLIQRRAPERRDSSGNLIDARKLARESVKGGADRAEVRNAFGDLMFEYPEIAHRA